MDYKIIFDKKALNFLNKLEIGIKKRIWNKLQECKQDPFHYLKSLIQVEGYKLRVGNYRVIISVEKNIKVLFIEKIGHRKNVYD